MGGGTSWKTSEPAYQYVEDCPGRGGCSTLRSLRRRSSAQGGGGGADRIDTQTSGERRSLDGRSLWQLLMEVTSCRAAQDGGDWRSGGKGGFVKSEAAAGP